MARIYKVKIGSPHLPPSGFSLRIDAGGSGVETGFVAIQIDSGGMGGV